MPGCREASPARPALELAAALPRVARLRHHRAVRLVTPVLAVLLHVALPLGVDALTVVTPELHVTLARGRGTIRFVAAVSAVVVKVALPVLGHALLVGALELVGPALLGLALGLVRVVPAVGHTVTEPALGDTQLVVTLPLLLAAAALAVRPAGAVRQRHLAVWTPAHIDRIRLD